MEEENKRDLLVDDEILPRKPEENKPEDLSNNEELDDPNDYEEDVHSSILHRFKLSRMLT
jgi:hypothetical protein